MRRYRVVVASTAAGSNTAPTGAPTINGTPQVGETLTANTSAIADENGLDDVSYSYQWIAGDGNSDTVIEEATDPTYMPSVSDVGKTITVRVSFTDDADNLETLNSEATVAVAATVPTAPQSLTVATGDQDQRLDVSWQGPYSNGGSDVAGYKVEWKESADSWETPADISEATVSGTTHTITGLTDGVEYSVRVSAVNDAGPGPPSAEASGTPQEAAIWSVTLTVGIEETFAGYTTFLTSGESNILGALSADTFTSDNDSHTVKALGVLDGKLILTVTPKLNSGFVLMAGMTEFASTDASIRETDSLIQFLWTDSELDWSDGEEVAVRLTKSTGLPTISGTPQVDETLTADTSPIDDSDGLTNATFEYQWIAGGSDIDGATGSSYELTASEQGKTIQVRVTFTDDRGNAESLTSVATDAVAAKPAPLTATFTNVPTSHGGSGATFTFDLAFSENLPLSYITLRDHAFTENDHGPVVRAQRKVQGSNQTWTITVEPKGNGAITITLPATTDCNDAGAICTSDGQKLSNSLSFTVSGPGG